MSARVLVRPEREASNAARAWTFRVVAAQLAVVVGLALLAAVLFGARAGYSGLAGAAISVVPSFYLAVRMFRQEGGAAAERLLRGIYFGELMKVLLTLALFVIALRLLDLDLVVVGGVYLAGVLVHWLALLFPERTVLTMAMRQATMLDVDKR
ncbi:MAG: ATP synthase subunit I [Gammaproteobacteria bacterium]|nr:ATP synthase subunit I [Gammaproteobacteria bacterium]